MLAEILRLIAKLRRPGDPAPARCAVGHHEFQQEAWKGSVLMRAILVLSDHCPRSRCRFQHPGIPSRGPLEPGPALV